MPEIPKDLRVFLNEVSERPWIYPETVVFNRVKDHAADLSQKEIAWLLSSVIVTTEFKVRILKTRCGIGDKLACETLDLIMKGDPYAKSETRRKGYMGLWIDEGDVEAGKMLLELGYITPEEFQKSLEIPEEKPPETTPEQQFNDLIVEAGQYPTASSFLTVVYSDGLKSVPKPNTDSIYKLIQSKYPSIEEFYNVVKRGEIKPKVEVPVLVPVPTVPGAPIEKPSEVAPPSPKLPEVAVPVVPPEPKPKPKPDLDLMRREIEDRIRKKLEGKKGGEVREARVEEDRAPVVRAKPPLEKVEAARKIFPPPEKSEERIYTEDELKKLPIEKRRELMKKVWSLGEELAEMAPPEDYGKWSFGNFDAFIGGADLDYLYELRDALLNESTLTEAEIETLLDMVDKRIVELESGAEAQAYG